MNRDDMLRVGVVTSAHGIKGEVKVFPTTDDPGRFKKLKDVYLDDGKELTAVRLKGARNAKNLLIVSFEGVDDRDAAQLLRKRDILIERKDARRLAKDEYLIPDLIGLTVKDVADGAKVGVLRNVLATGANDVYEIEIDAGWLYLGQKPKAHVFYAPAIKQCVRSVDMDKREMMIHVMPGLIEV